MPGRPLFLGEGARDVGVAIEGRRRIPCAFEGDVPRLVRRIAELSGKEMHFGYDAMTFREVVARIPRTGRPTRIGGKSKDLRDAIFHSLRDSQRVPAAILAVLDARADEFVSLQKDAAEILAECGGIRADVPVVIGIALHEIEIWMLADAVARTAAFGAQVAQTPLLGGGVENLPDPKALWSTYAGRAAPPDGVAQDLHRDQQRLAAWASLQPEVVCEACPRGFAPFHAALHPALRAFLG
jgi:hypothetical protein